jgi:CTP synthase
MSSSSHGSQFPKFIFVSGGVLSGLGKGVTAASIGLLLKLHGFSVTFIKCENYLNLDSGNINPTEHGDVFLCEDGTEADLDLGTYERFLGQAVSSRNFTTMGQIYTKVIEDTKNLSFNGATVDAFPYVPEEVIRRIRQAAEGNQVVIVELGGTAGEYQNSVYYEAYRMLKMRQPQDTIHVHVTYFPLPDHVGELKSKPTQLSVRLLNGMGIQPDFIVGRAAHDIDAKRKEKVAFYCNLDVRDVISNPDSQTIYELPLIFLDQAFDKRILEKLHLTSSFPHFEDWKHLVKVIKAEHKQKIRVAIIAKYIATGNYELKDSYVSLLEALQHSGWYNEVEVEPVFINAEQLEKDFKTAKKQLETVDGIIVPIGWGERGVEGKIAAVKYARENKVPYLGLCYGMQLAAVEFARNVVGLKGAHTTEVNEKTEYPIIYQIPFDERYQRIKSANASMRLGGYDCVLKAGSLAAKIYDKHDAWKDKKTRTISERHRHRFEFNNEYRKQLEDQGFVISGTSPDDFFVEMIELPEKAHPFFIATQAHPEYKSQPLTPHPIFIEYVLACVKNSK